MPAEAASSRVSSHGRQLEVHHVVPMGKHLLQRRSQRLLVVAQPLIAVRGPERGQLTHPLARPAGTVGRIRHRDDAPAILLRGADGVFLVLVRIDERQHGHVVQRGHAGDEFVETPLCAKRWRARQKWRDKEDGQASARYLEDVAEGHLTCFAGGDRVAVDAEIHTYLDSLGRYSDSYLGLTRSKRRQRPQEGSSLYVHLQCHLFALGHVRLPTAVTGTHFARPVCSAGSRARADDGQAPVVTASLLAMANAGATVKTLVHVPRPRSP